MARYVDAVDLPFSPIAAFDYLAGFEHTADWDPGVVEARRLDPSAPLGRGSRFEVVAAFFGRRVPMVYEITVFEPPHRVVLRGTGGNAVSIDTISFTPIPNGTRVTWDARLELTGFARVADPLLQLAFQWIGARAVQGLVARAAAVTRRERRVARRRDGRTLDVASSPSS
jgi:hypothetical protein